MYRKSVSLFHSKENWIYKLWRECKPYSKNDRPQEKIEALRQEWKHYGIRVESLVAEVKTQQQEWKPLDKNDLWQEWKHSAENGSPAVRVEVQRQELKLCGDNDNSATRMEARQSEWNREPCSKNGSLMVKLEARQREWESAARRISE